MASDVRVVEDGLEQRPPVRRPASAWVWLVTGIAVGLGFGVVLFTPSTTDVDEREAAATAPPIAPIEEVANPRGVADVIPGFPDALVVVTGDDGQNLNHILWPLAGDEVTRPLPVGDFGHISFDASGAWLAISTEVPDAEGFVLSMGKPAAVKPLAFGVTSFAWHDSEAAVLSYTQLVDGEWLLWVVGPNRVPELVIRGISPKSRVLAWGDWGWAVYELAEEGGVWLLNDSGQVRATKPGFAYGSHPSGWVVIINEDDVRLVSSGGGVKGVDMVVDSVAPVVAASISPDRKTLAVLGSSGLKVASLDGEGQVIQLPRSFGVAQLAWSSDSRFVLVPATRGVVVVDTEGGKSQLVLSSYVVRALGVIPLSGS